MITHLRSAFVFTSLLSFAMAQSPPTPDLERIVRPWPGSLSTGDVTDLACGRFMVNHPARFAVSLRNNELVVSAQPALFEHFVATGFTGVQAIATVDGFGSAPDRLVAVTAQGLRCLRYDGTNGFVDVQAQGSLTAFAGDDDVGSLPATVGGVETRFVIGYKASAVHVATIDADGFMTQVSSLPAPPNTVAYHATLVGSTVGGSPMIALVTNVGLLVLDIAGNLIDSHLASVSAGRLCALPGAVTMVVQTGANWNVATWSASTGQVTGGGTLSLPAPLRGLAKCNLNNDGHPDVVLTTGDQVLRALLGSSTGPQVGPQSPIHIADNDLPGQPPVANLATAFVGDIDRDGADDVVNVNKNKLSVFPNVRSQVQEHVFGVEDDGDATPTLKFVEPLGFETESNALAMLFPGHPGKHGFGLRLRLPEDNWTWGDSVRAVVYAIPDANGAVLRDPDHYSFPLVETDVDKDVDAGDEAVVDLMIPVRDHTETGVGEPPFWDGQRYVLELSLQKNAGGETAPIAIEFGNRTGNETSFGGLLATFSAGYPWLFEVVAVALLNFWGLGAMPPAGQPDPNPNGNEFIGAIVLVERVRGTDSPDLDGSTPVGNAVVHGP